jgi:hypothetical protein
VGNFWIWISKQKTLGHMCYCYMTEKLYCIHYFIIFSQPAWFICNDGSCERDLLSHNKWNMAWLLRKMAWFNLHLVQLHNFWTSNALIFAKWQHIKQGFFRPFQGQQLFYIVYDYNRFLCNKIKPFNCLNLESTFTI